MLTEQWQISWSLAMDLLKTPQMTGTPETIYCRHLCGTYNDHL